MSISEQRWARVVHAESYGLRRGAWYRVINEATTEEIVVLDINRQNRPVHRRGLQFCDEEPKKWSVVRRDADESAAQRATEMEMARVYGVCPNCWGRTNLMESDQTATCPECGLESGVDWDNPC